MSLARRLKRLAWVNDPDTLALKVMSLPKIAVWSPKLEGRLNRFEYLLDHGDTGLPSRGGLTPTESNRRWLKRRLGTDDVATIRTMTAAGKEIVPPGSRRPRPAQTRDRIVPELVQCLWMHVTPKMQGQLRQEPRMLRRVCQFMTAVFGDVPSPGVINDDFIRLKRLTRFGRRVLSEIRNQEARRVQAG